MKSLAIIGGVLLSIPFILFAVTCTGKAPATDPAAPSSTSLPATESTAGPASSATSGNLPLRTLRDVPLSGSATRFDYQSFDPNSGRLYIAHLGDSSMVVFDTKKETMVGEVKTLAHVHGILAVPELHRVYASVTASNELAVIDDSSLQIIARAPAGDYPDGVAYASKANKINVSDLHGKTETAIDARTNQRVATIALGGGAGNTQYDSVLERIFVTVHGQNSLAEIDPNKDQVVGQYSLGLYVSAESGIITIFDERGYSLEKVGEGFFAAN